MQQLNKKSFVSTGDYNPRDFGELVEKSLAYKRGQTDLGQPLVGKVVGLLFFNSSLRTRASMAVAVTKLGGTPLILDIGNGVWSLETELGVIMNGNKAEHLNEAIPVLTQYVDLLGVRCFPAMEDISVDRIDPLMQRIVQLSRVPVVNLESAWHHPFQALADMMTIKENLGKIGNTKIVLSWANHPKPLPMAVPNSFALASIQCGADLTIACPPEYELDHTLMSQLKSVGIQTGGTVEISHDQESALQGAEVVYAKSWGAIPFYGHPQAEAERRRSLDDWRIDSQKMLQTNEAIFMHCLPVRRNVIVTDEVIDGSQSRVVQQAGNRLFGQATVLAELMKGSGLA